MKKFDNSEILENMENEDNIDININDKWENIKTVIKETEIGVRIIGE